MNRKLVEYMFTKAERGEWDNFKLEDASKELNLKLNVIMKIIPNKESFLAYYNNCVDDYVINSLTKEDIMSVDKDEVLKEYFMSKLEYMNEFKLGFANLLNNSISNPKFILVNLKANKKSIKKYTKKLFVNNTLLKNKLFNKILMSIWLLAFHKWLYEGNDNSTSYALLDKSFKFFKEKTNLFN